MGLFSKSQPKAAPEPVRRDKVMGILAATMAEADGDPDSEETAEVSRRLSDASRNATQAERCAASEAARRHGY